MTATTAATARNSGLTLREYVAAWVIAATLVTAVAASSLVALLFDGWL